MARKPKIKRGPKPRDGETSSNVTVRLNNTERAAYQAAADRYEHSLAVWIRAACEARLKI
jgi:hypothetical protein